MLIVTEILDVVYVRLKNLIYVNNATGFNLALTQTAKENASNALKTHARTVIPPTPVNVLHVQTRIIVMLHLSANPVLRTASSVKITKLAMIVFMVLD